MSSTFTVVLSPDEDTGGYSVTCPALPGAVSQGETRDEALSNIREAMELWLEDGSPPLQESPELIAAEIAFVLGWRAEEGWPLIVETTTLTLPAAVAA
jgi:predicted RNase H-like HicB family nuclease